MKNLTQGKGPTPFLKEMYSRLNKGKTLDVGMGEGVNAVFLAQKGFQVKGFDISQTALDHAQKLAQETGVQIEAKKGDLNFFLFGLMEYDTIIMTYFRPPVSRYYSEIIRALKQGGMLLIESYSVEQMTDIIHSEMDFKDYFFKSNEVLHNLKGMKILFYQEGKVGDKHVVQCLAQKPLDKDAAKYNLFDMQSGPKENKQSAHMKLAESLFKKKE